MVEFVAFMLVLGVPSLFYILRHRCLHDWERIKEITTKDMGTIENIIYIHECKKCKKIKRQKVEVC